MKIWYDVSGLYRWNGNLTGIQRVVFHLADELTRADHDAHFYIYKRGGFQEVDFQAIKQRIVAERSRSHAVASAKPPTGIINARALGHYQLLALKHAFHGTRLDPPLRATYRLIAAGYHALRNGRAGAKAGSLFSRGDVVVVVDGNWQFTGYAQALAEAKRQSGCSIVHFVHDLTALTNPALVNPGATKVIGNYFKSIFVTADLLLPISKSTERDIAWYAHEADVPMPKTQVVRLADNSIVEGSQDKATKPSAEVPKPFILAVGTVEIRKNYTVFYYAYKLALAAGKQLPHLVIAGKKGWMAEEAHALLTQDPVLRQHVTVVAGPSDPELAWLYQHCLFTVFPSFYEGWGLPVAESFAYGKACVSSNTSSMPEVGGRLATYTSPYDPAAWVDSIICLANDKQLLQSTEVRIKKEYRHRSWKMTYRDFEAALANLTSN